MRYRVTRAIYTTYAVALRTNRVTALFACGRAQTPPPILPKQHNLTQARRWRPHLQAPECVARAVYVPRRAASRAWLADSIRAMLPISERKPPWNIFYSPSPLSAPPRLDAA